MLVIESCNSLFKTKNIHRRSEFVIFFIKDIIQKTVKTNIQHRPMTALIHLLDTFSSYRGKETAHWVGVELGCPATHVTSLECILSDFSYSHAYISVTFGNIVHRGDAIMCGKQDICHIERLKCKKRSEDYFTCTCDGIYSVVNIDIFWQLDSIYKLGWLFLNSVQPFT